MRISIERAALQSLLAATVKVVETRNTIPILSTVRLVVAGGTLTVTASDLDIEVSASTPLLDASDGAFCVDARTLDGIVKKAVGDISLETKDGNVVVAFKRSRFTLPTLPADDFPSMDAGKFHTEFEADLAALFAPVKFAISTEEARYYLNGAFLHTVDGKLAAVATDGHRLALHVSDDDSTIAGAIVPRKAVDTMLPGRVSVSMSDTKIRAAAGGIVMVSKFIDGTFPDYQRILPAANDNVMIFDKAAMRAAVDRVALISDKGRAAKFAFANGGCEITLRGDGSEAADAVECEATGEPVEIGFNTRYVLDTLAVMPDGEVRFALGDSGTPAMVTGGKEGLRLVIMPVRIS
jgi:DNA polymerase-3 subunit beta